MKQINSAIRQHEGIGQKHEMAEAAIPLFQSIARLLMNFGLGYRDVKGYFPRAFVEAALHDFEAKEGADYNVPYRKLIDKSGTHERVVMSVMTGRSVKAKPAQKHSLIKLVGYWNSTPPYCKDGNARILPIQSEVGGDFRSLCKETMPHRGYSQVLDDLVEGGTVSVKNNKVKQESVLARITSERLSEGLAECVGSAELLINTMCENLNSARENHIDGMQRLMHLELNFSNDYDVKNVRLTVSDLRKLLTEYKIAAIEILKAAENQQGNTRPNLTHEVHVGLLLKTTPQLTKEDL